MVWFKVDDKHHDHRKTRRALRSGAKRRDASVIGLWCLAGSWSADNLMDGFVPTDELMRWDDNWTDLAKRLVEAEFWEPATKDGEDGFQFINWDKHQPMKTEVEAKREAARERMRSVRAKGGRGSGEVRANVQENVPENFAGSSRDVRSTPTRPDPSRPVPTTDADASVSAGKPRAKRATTRPADFRPTQAHIDLANELGVDLRAEWQQFCDHHDAKGSTYKDWSAALRTWIRNATKYGGRRQAASGPSNVQQHLDLARRLAQDEVDGQATIYQIGGGR